jgi:hypothetical protein
LLIHFYPASFRHVYGEEMRAVFARRRREATGQFGVALLWLAATGEVLGNAGLVHLDILKQDLAYTGRVLEVLCSVAGLVECRHE